MTISSLISLVVILNTGLPVIQEGRPSWIDNPEKSYPNAQYMTAIGSGDTRKDAENSAASNLSKIFESNIKSEESINARYTELMKNQGQSSLESETNINKNISVSSQQTLYNIRYAESYTDQLGRIFVLAVIERIPTAQIYQNKIDESDGKVFTYLDFFGKSSDPAARYAYVNAAQVLCEVEDNLQQQLNIILPGTSYAVKSGNNLEKVSGICAEARKAIDFQLEISGENQADVTNMVSETLSDLGFAVNPAGLLQVKGNSTIERIDLNSEQKFVRWSYTLSIYDHAGKQLASLSENGREGHINYEEAKARALRTMKQKINSGLTKQINGYFDGIVLR